MSSGLIAAILFRTHGSLRQEEYSKSNLLHSCVIVSSSCTKLNCSYILSSTGQASPINDLVGLLEFTEDELRQTQKGLDAAGITLPNFKNVSRELQKEPTPEPEETEEKRIDRELHECKHEILEMQACIRGVLVRGSVSRLRSRLRKVEPDVVGLQSLIRGQMVRGIFEDHLRAYQSSVQWATMVPTFV